MKGYKIFDGNLCCRGFQYKVGEVFSEDVRPLIGVRGFHFSPTLAECTVFTTFNNFSRVCEVESLGDIQEREGLSMESNIVQTK